MFNFFDIIFDFFKYFNLDFLYQHLPTWVPISMIMMGMMIMVFRFFFKMLIPLQVNIIAFIVSLFLLISGGYIKGREDIRNEAERMVAEVKQNVHAQTIVTERVVTKYLTKIIRVKDTNEQIQKQITTQNDAKCSIPQSYVSLLNDAATNTVPSPSAGTNGTPSSITLSESERVIAENYELYNKVSEQLKALQAWVREQQNLHQISE
jgi:hypothetical protein